MKVTSTSIYLYVIFMGVVIHVCRANENLQFGNEVTTQLRDDSITIRNNNIAVCLVNIYMKQNEVRYEVMYLSDDIIYYKRTKLVSEINLSNLIEVWKEMSSFVNCFISNALTGTMESYFNNLFLMTHQFMSPFHENYGVTNLQLLDNSTYMCSGGSMTLIKTIAKLINHTANDLTNIIIEEDDCSKIFAQVLQDTIAKDTPSKTTVLYEVSVAHVTRGLQKILMDVKEKKKDRRVYIVLASIQVTELIFAQANEYELNQFQDIWITSGINFNKSTIPNVLIKCNLNERSQFRPNNHPHQNITTDENMIRFDWIKLNDIERRNFSMNTFESMEEEESMEVSLWWKGEQLQVQTVNSDEQLINLITKVRDTGIFVVNTGTIKNLVVVSILGGPFLYDAHYLLNINKSGCDGNSMICKKANTSSEETIWYTTCCYGYTVDVLKQLSNLLKCEFSLYLVKDGKYGGLNSTSGTFNGMIGDVIDQTASMAIAGLTINEERSRFVDFTTPFMRSEIGIVTLRNEPEKSYLNIRFINNIGVELALTIGLFYLVSIVVIYFIDNKALKRLNMFNRKYRQRQSRDRYIWQEAFTYISGLTFQREIGGENPHTKGGRTTALFMAFGMVVVSTMYTASLTAALVSTKDDNKFLGLKDERISKLDKSFKFATTKDTSIEAFFKNSTDPSLRRMHMFMKKYNVDFFDQGMNQVRDGELQAFLHEYPFMNYYIATTSCELELHENSVGQTYYGIAIQKNSFLKDILSEAILFLHEDGLLHELQNKWVSNRCETENQENAQFSLEFFATPLLLVLFVILVCGGILLAEVIYWKRHHKQRKQSHHFSSWATEDSFRDKYYKRRTRSSLTSLF